MDFEIYTNMNKFYKWCNCERTLGNIYVKCYDTSLEANLEYKKNNSEYNEYSDNYGNNEYTKNEIKLVGVFRYMPQFMQSYIIQNAFKNPVIYMQDVKDISIKE